MSRGAIGGITDFNHGSGQTGCQQRTAARSVAIAGQTTCRAPPVARRHGGEIAGRVAGGLDQRVVLVDGAAVLGQAEQHQRQGNDQDAELDRRHATLAFSGGHASPLHYTSTGTRGPAVPPASPKEEQGEPGSFGSPRYSKTTSSGPLIGLNMSTHA